MSLSLTEYRAKLIAKIMGAYSQDDVKRFVNAAMKSLEKHQLNEHIVRRFIDKMLDELASFSPMDEEAQQWSNINMARICFNQIKRKLDVATQL